MKVKKMKFPLTSEQLELLVAFEQHSSLKELAEFMGKDQSVVSRQLQRLGEDCPVIKKVSGKWSITPLGTKINELTAKVITEYEKNLADTISSSINFDQSVLVVINAQKALLTSTAHRSNQNAEKNIQVLLEHWRNRRQKIIHVQHLSENPDSNFFHTSPLVKFIPEISPVVHEPIIQKKHSSSFTNTQLEDLLRNQNISTVVLAGFTANDCIEATARESFEKGFNTYVVADGTAMFDFIAHDKKLYRAEKMHELVLANIGLRYGQVEDTRFFLEKE